jgi:hypothetical protein
MSETSHEERAALHLWDHVERLREGEAVEPAPTDLGPEASEDLRGVTETAADVATWMAAEGEPAARRASIRQQMWSRIADLTSTPERSSARPPRETRALAAGRPWHAWQWAAAAAVLAAVLTPLASRLIGPEQPGAAPHEDVVREVAQLAANRMPPEETRAAWQHILECPGCFERYREAWKQQRRQPDGARAPREEAWRLVWAPRR